MTLLEKFVQDFPEFKITGDRINGVHGYLSEINGELWMWTHSYSPVGHQFYPLKYHYQWIGTAVLLSGIEWYWDEDDV